MLALTATLLGTAYKKWFQGSVVFRVFTLHSLPGKHSYPVYPNRNVCCMYIITITMIEEILGIKGLEIYDQIVE